MNTAFTKGPWVVTGPWIQNGRQGLYSVEFGDKECIAEVVHTEADAHLIAAAPDMLIKLEKARSVIASLRRSMMAHPDHVEDSEFDTFTTMAQRMEDEIEAQIAKATPSK